MIGNKILADIQLLSLQCGECVGHECGKGVGPEAKQGFDPTSPGSTLTTVVFGEWAAGPVRL